ncbi:hypothetical protein AO391_24575 [Pseudomonas marginalis ICMP 9505]|nr:hypothetical protein AO391_24575 [Pseudomonas marginalis ICMP 9505]
MLKFTLVKKPAQWRAHLCVAVFSPADPDGSALKVLDSDANRFADLIHQALPIFGLFMRQPMHSYRLDLLNARRSY